MRAFHIAVGMVCGVLMSAFAWTIATSRAADETMITAFTVTNISDILKEVGATNVEPGKIDAINVVRFTADGRKYTAFLDDCPKGSDKCLGLEIGAFFSGTAVSLEAMNTFNNNYVFGKGARSPDEKTIISMRYLIADGGISRANVVSEFKTTFVVTDHLIEQLRASEHISSASGVAAPSYAEQARGTHAATGSGGAPDGAAGAIDVNVAHGNARPHVDPATVNMLTR